MGLRIGTLLCFQLQDHDLRGWQLVTDPKDKRSSIKNIFLNKQDDRSSGFCDKIFYPPLEACKENEQNQEK